MSIHELAVTRAQVAMKKSRMDALVLSLGVNYYYFTGLWKLPSERLLITIIPKEGRPIVIAPAFEEEIVRNSSKTRLGSIKAWQEHEDPYELVKKAFQEIGIMGIVGMDGRFEYRFSKKLEQAIPDVRFELADDLISSLRITKSREELDLMKQACTCVAAGIKAGFESVAVGRTELECTQVIFNAITKAGGSSSSIGGLRSGAVTALPHGVASDKVIKRGEMILIDMAAAYKNYRGDMTRMAVVGEPTDKMKKVYKIVLDAQLKAIRREKAGIEAQEVDRVARRVISDAGFGPNFTHRVGHGIGLETHEEPYMVEGNNLKLRPYMCHSVEPGIYLLEKWGIRIEDIVAVTEGGVEILSEGLYPKEEITVLS
jgi:Xaa-Pro aminopeptidase